MMLVNKQPYLNQKCFTAILAVGILMSHLFVSAQSGKDEIIVRGRILDSVLNRGCSMATVMIITADSTLIQFTRSRRDGSFVFNLRQAGNYTLFVTHPAFSLNSKNITVDLGVHPDLGTINLFPRSGNLEPVIVTPRSLHPKMNGDTLEFNTANIKTKVNATVEDLLRRLPGVHVDANGTIMVNGRKIEKLLIDGEDVFGGDPTIVTRNFNADMISRVQVLDKKSDQFQFTGVEDGRTTKTLNLTLKQDSKRGNFNKIEAGGDPEGYYNLSGLSGAFKGARQLATIVSAANTGNTNFSGTVSGFGSDINVGGAINDPLGTSAGLGIPRVIGGGSHFANRWGGMGDHIVGNYLYGHVVTKPFSSSIVRQTLPDSIYLQQQESRSSNSHDQHGVNADFDYIPDSLSAFRFSLSGLAMSGSNQFESTSSSSFNDTLVNSSIRVIQSDIHNQNLKGSVMWGRRGRKEKNRKFSVITAITRENNTTTGRLYALNSFYKSGGGILQTDTTDQRKQISNLGVLINSSLNYTEPLWRNTVFATTYSLSINRSQSLFGTYNKGDGKYDEYVDSLSSHYQNNVLTQRATFNVQANDKHLKYTIGADLLRFSYTQKDLLKDALARYSYFNISPRINGAYNIDSYKGAKFTYYGQSLQPTIRQLQPVQNNNDPLHIVVGNPNLRASFSHHFGISFFTLKYPIIDAGLQYGFTNNSVSTKVVTDSLGRQVSQSVNTNGAHYSGAYISMETQVEQINLNIGFNGTLNLVRNVNYINQDLSRNDNCDVAWGISLNKQVPDKYDILISSNIGFSSSASSINIAAKTHFWTQNYIGNISIFAFSGFDVNVNATYNWRQKIDDFDKHNTEMLLNAYINRNFFSSKLGIRFQINDILRQSIGVSRSISTNQTSENRVNTIGQYWLISASYRLVHHRKVH